jgi:hypothetical protein
MQAAVHFAIGKLGCTLRIDRNSNRAGANGASPARRSFPSSCHGDGAGHYAS